MANSSPTRQAHPYRHASEIPQEVWSALWRNEAAANVILPFARKALGFPPSDDNKWIALYDDTKNVEFVLSCTKGPLGNYPIFIVACKSSAETAEEDRDRDLADSLLPLALCLLDESSLQRVFSVFAIAKVSKKFAEILKLEAHRRQMHDFEVHEAPFYDATFTFCTAETFIEPQCLTFPLQEPDDVDIAIALRRADMSHLEELKVLCKAFSDTSPPYVLEDARAELEASTMITNEQAWVHTVQKKGQEPEIACLVATTRESDNVTAVTKVFTAERWRSRRCAARLLHRVCQDIFQKRPQQRVVLYVGNSDELAPARKVYHKIGFQGLDRSQDQQVEDVERWLEIGFKGTTLGYW